MMRAALISLVLLIFSVFSAAAQGDRAATAMARAMQAVDKNAWEEARSAAAPAGAIGRDIVEWHRLRAGDGSFADYVAFLERRPDWPGLPLLIASGEENIPASAKPAQVIAYFATQAPRSGAGALRLARALEASGQAERAHETIIRAWRSLSMDEAEEKAILSRYAKVLVNHHRARQDMLLWRGLTTQAQRLNKLVGTSYARLTVARVALIRNQKKGVTQLIDAVPSSLANDPGLAFARFTWRLKNGQKDGAIALMLERSISVKALGQPERWGSKRRSLARELMRAGKARTAYRLAANHFLTEGSHFKDLEWLAGYIALRYLKDPKTALAHFRRFRAGVSTPISLGRAGYWEGRALEALGNKEAARLAYEFGAEFQTSFYGQLAAEKAGITMQRAIAGRESYADFLASPFANTSVFEAAVLLQRAGRPDLFKRFMRHLIERLGPAEQGSLAQFALNVDEINTGLYLAKYAASNGLVLVRPYFPVPKGLVDHVPVRKDLALSIIRRESEFFAAARSRAGARGLMQLMPGTARDVAKRQGMPYKRDRLTSDPEYNVRLGSAHLRELMDEFDGYIPFVAVAYNAGPRRVPQWVQQLGDPRKSTETAVDWIEAIPFRETRNYVMRVMESLDVYRARLARKPQPWSLARELRGR